MSNQIRLKRASGSDPGASDLVLGEPAVRTDTGEIFLKKDDGSIAKVAGGIDDGDKGDVTVSNSGATFTIDNGVINNAKIASNASMSLSKLEVITSNRIVGNDSGNAVPKELTAAEVRTIINVENGATADQSAAEIRALVESASDSNVFTDADHSKLNGIASGATNVTNTNQLTNGAGFITATLTNEQVQDIVGGMVSGNTESGITVTYQDSDGTLDFSVASQTDQNFTTTLKNKLDGIASGATNVTNTNQLTNGAGFITATLTNEQVQDIVGGMVSGNTESGITVTYQDGDGTLDFSVASQTDNNFTNADHSKLDGIESGATADQTASEILTLIKTVDGSGSGLDADTLDGVSSGSFARSDAEDTITGKFEFTSSGSYPLKINGSDDSKILLKGSSNPLIKFQESTTDKATIRWNASGYLLLRNDEDGAQINIQDNLTFSPDSGSNNYKIWHENNDGAGSGLDADTLDGVSAGGFLSSDNADTASGDITFSGGAGAVSIAANSDIRFTNGTWTGNSTKIQHHNNSLYIQGGSGATDTMALIFRSSGGTNRWIIDSSGHFHPHVDSTYDIGTSSKRIRIGYFDEVDSGEVRVNNGILETKAAIATSHTLTADYNALAVSPTINNGVTVTVPSGAVWAIV